MISARVRQLSGERAISFSISLGGDFPLQCGRLHELQNFRRLASASDRARSILGPMWDASLGGFSKRRSGFTKWLLHQEAFRPSRTALNIPRRTTSRARASSMLHPRHNGGAWNNYATKTASAARNYGVPRTNINQSGYFRGFGRHDIDALHLTKSDGRGSFPQSSDNSIHLSAFSRARPNRCGFPFLSLRFQPVDYALYQNISGAA
jgi:hypothetical protein